MTRWMFTDWRYRHSRLVRVNDRWFVDETSPDINDVCLRPVRWWSPADLIRFPLHWWWARRWY